MGNGKTIPVLDSKNKFLSFTHPAKARKLVKDGKCVVFNNDPFVIKKIEGNGRHVMTEKKFINFTDFFREEQDVWIQNVSGTMQISMEFITKNGQAVNYLLPRGRKPQNLSQRVPFDAIKNSMDLRNLLNRRPRVLRLMDAEEALEFYQKRAEENKTSLEDELEESFTIQRNLQEKKLPTVDEAPVRKTLEEQEKLVEEVSESIHPRIIGMCQESKKDPENKVKRLEAKDFLDELGDLEGILSVDDISYVASHAAYKTVRNWANQRLLKSDSETEGESDSPE